MSAAIGSLATYDEDNGDLLAVVETPKGSRNKYSFNEKLGVFELKKALPRGMSFPYDFGFIPATEGGDGDPLDVLILLDEPAPVGCVVRIRPIGAIEAEQRRAGSDWTRNDRLVAVAKFGSDANSLGDIGAGALDEIEAFFRNYLGQEGQEVRVLRRSGPEAASRLIEEGRHRRATASRK